MKKTTAWMIVLLLLFSLFAGCTGNDPTPDEPVIQPTAEPILTPAPTDEEEEEVHVDPSEWETADSPALTEEALALFQKAFAGLLGVHYVPVAYLGRQVVTGTVHTFLTRATVI